MAGIAAEAIKYDQAEGGSVDERSLIQFLTTIQPPWNILYVYKVKPAGRCCKRFWCCVSTKSRTKRLSKHLRRVNLSEDCVEAIERNLPSVLPSTARLQDRAQKETKADMNALRLHQKENFQGWWN